MDALLFVGILLFFIGNDLMYLLRLCSLRFDGFYTIGMLVINFFIGYFSLIQMKYLKMKLNRGLITYMRWAVRCCCRMIRERTLFRMVRNIRVRFEIRTERTDN
jgi:hypothetical protein